MIRITKLAKFPLEFSKGTSSERIELAKRLNADFFERISKKFRTGEVSFDTFERTLKESIPTKSSVKVEKVDDGVSAYGYTSINSKNNVNINGFIINLPKNENGKIPLSSVSTFMHETYHYFSQMTSPKETRRIAKLLETGNKDIFDSVYEFCLYTTKFDFSKEHLSALLDNFLSRLSIEKKIDFLQYCRYGLGNEANAFAEGEKYGRLAQGLFKDKISEPISIYEGKPYNFDMKLELLNDKLAAVMNDFRAC